VAFLHISVLFLLLLFIIASTFVSSILVVITSRSSNTYGLDANTTTTGAKPFLTLEKPMLGFKMSYPSDWNITDNDFVIYFRAPQNAALVIFSITNLSSSSSKTNPTLEQYSSNEINTIIKSIESKKVGNFFKLLESTPYLLSGEPEHEIVFLNGTNNADPTHTYKTSIIWTIVGSKVYQIDCHLYDRFI
jgi:hypothetical protein